MGSLIPLTDLVLILVSGAVGGFLAIKVKLPSIIGYILAGLALSITIPMLGLDVPLNSAFTSRIAELGIALLLFAAGIEFSIGNLNKVRNLVIAGTMIQTVVMIVVGTLLMQLVGLQIYEAFFVGVVAASSSTAFVLKMLEQKEEISAKTSKIMIGWLITQDVLVIALFLLLKTFAPNAEGSVSILEPIAKGILLIVLTLGIGRYLVPKVFAQIAKTGSQELLLVSVIALSIGFAFLAESFGVTYTLGAFLAGMALSETFLQHEIFSEIKPLRDLFSMVFFVSIGSLFQINTLLDILPALLVVLFIMLSIKVLTIFSLCVAFNQHPKNALKIGLGISQIGEFAFLCISIGFASGWINSYVYSLVLIATISSMTLTPFLYSSTNVLYKILEENVKALAPGLYRKIFARHTRDTSDIAVLSNHIIIAGYGKVGRYVAHALQLAKESYVVVELDADLSKKAEEEEHKIIFGDATKLDILKTANIQTAKAIIITLPEKNINELENLLIEIKGINPEIEILLRSSGQVVNLENIRSVVEPEFEAAIRIINNMEGIVGENVRSLARRVRSYKSKEIPS